MQPAPTPPTSAPPRRDPADPGIARAMAAVGVVAVSVVLGFVWYLRSVAPPPGIDLGHAGKVLPVALGIPELELLDQHGAPFGRARLQGGWSLLFFGYTYCPDVCPLTLQNLAGLRERLDALDVGVVFVSVDPERDPPERLAEYVAFFDPAFTGVSGETGEIARLASAVGAFHRRGQTLEDGEGYLVDHSAFLFLVGPDARLHAVLEDPHDPDEFMDLVRRVQAVERNAEGEIS